MRADLAREAETETLVPRAAEALGPLTCLVNNASTFELDLADTVTRASWDAHLETNLRAPFLLTQAFARQLPEGEAGNVVNLLDQRVWNLTPYFVSYTVSKTGLWTLTRSLALALAPRIRVNAIGPGPALKSPRQTEADFARQCEMTPLKRGTSPEEICDAVRFILGRARPDRADDRARRRAAPGHEAAARRLAAARIAKRPGRAAPDAARGPARPGPSGSTGPEPAPLAEIAAAISSRSPAVSSRPAAPQPAVDLLRRARADDGAAHARPGQRPGHRHRGDRGAVAQRDRPQRVAQREVALERGRAEVGRATAPVVGRQRARCAAASKPSVSRPDCIGL